jgi:pyridoxine 4-dehydrogenase
MTTDNGLNAAAAGIFKFGNVLEVNRLAFGAMQIGNRWGKEVEPETAVKVIRKAYELGCNYIDTAGFYRNANELIARALYPYPEDLVIGTKIGPLFTPEPKPGTDAKNLRLAVEENLRDLRVDCLDLVHFRYMGQFGDKTPITESYAAMAELQKEGKIKHIGISSVELSHLEEALKIAPVASVQNAYNIVDRRSESILKKCEKENIAFMPYFPLLMGKLNEVPEPLVTIAGKYGCTVAQVALAWLLQHSPVMLPIPGTSSLSHLEENVAAAAIRLSREDYQFLDNNVARENPDYFNR